MIYNYILSLFLIFFRRLYVVKHKYSGTYKNEGDKKVHEPYSTLLGEHKLGEEDAEYGCHKAEYRNFRYGIELEEHSPERISDSGEEGEVNEDSRAADGEVIDLTARDKSNDDHNGTAHHKLIAADYNGILVLRKDLDKHRGECKGDGREEDECVAREVHSEIKAVKVDGDDACKSYDARNDLLGGELLLSEDKAGDEDGKEGGRAGDDSSLRARGISKSYVEEEILNYGLEECDDTNLAKVLALGVKDSLTCYAVDSNGDKSCRGKADAGEENGGGNVGLSTLEHNLVAHLDKGSCTTPKGTAKHSSDNDKQGRSKQLRNVEFLSHFYLFSIKRSERNRL